MGKKIWNYGYMVKLLFGDDVGFKMIPYVQCEDSRCVVRPLDEEELEQFQNNISRISKIINDRKRLVSEFESMSQQRAEYEYLPVFRMPLP